MVSQILTEIDSLIIESFTTSMGHQARLLAHNGGNLLNSARRSVVSTAKPILQSTGKFITKHPKLIAGGLAATTLASPVASAHMAYAAATPVRTAMTGGKYMASGVAIRSATAAMALKKTQPIGY